MLVTLPNPRLLRIGTPLILRNSLHMVSLPIRTRLMLGMATGDSITTMFPVLALPSTELDATIKRMLDEIGTALPHTVQNGLKMTLVVGPTIVATRDHVFTTPIVAPRHLKGSHLMTMAGLVAVEGEEGPCQHG